jgi:hypothetical protein
MADIGGAWQCSVDTPFGVRNFSVEITPSGEQFQALVKGNFGEMLVTDGTIIGDEMKWSMAITTPVPMTFNCKAEVSDGTLNGTVSAGVFGKYPLKGHRV